MRKVLIVLSVVLILTLVFSAGVFASGNGLLNGAWTNMRGNIETETDAMMSNVELDMSAKVEEVLQGTVDAQTIRSLNEIQEYYNQQLEEIKTNPQMINLSIELMHNTTALINEQKNLIDNEISRIINGE